MPPNVPIGTPLYLIGGPLPQPTITPQKAAIRSINAKLSVNYGHTDSPNSAMLRSKAQVTLRVMLPKNWHMVTKCQNSNPYQKNLTIKLSAKHSLPNSGKTYSKMANALFKQIQVSNGCLFLAITKNGFKNIIQISGSIMSHKRN